MVYVMEFFLSTACGTNGRGGDNVFGVSTCVMMLKLGGHVQWTNALPGGTHPVTPQRAELTALLIALDRALDRYSVLEKRPQLQLMIYTDSRYVVDSMTERVHKWADNGWINAVKYPVANRDLFEAAMGLEARLRKRGQVRYMWIPRHWNRPADVYAREYLQRLVRGDVVPRS